MSDEKNRQEMVRIYRDPATSDDVVIEVLGQPIVALKQMKAEPWALKDKTGPTKAE